MWLALFDDSDRRKTRGMSTDFDCTDPNYTVLSRLYLWQLH